MSYIVNVNLTKFQLKNRALKNKNFQIKNDQMTGDVKIELSKKLFQLFNRNKKNKKGFRFTDYQVFDGDEDDDEDEDEEVEGGRINLKKLGRRLTKKAKKLKSQARKYANHEGKAHLKNVGKKLARETTGLAADGIRYGINYAAGPEAVTLADPFLNKLEKRANKETDKQINGLGLGTSTVGTLEKKLEKNILGLYTGSRMKRTIIDGAGLKQINGEGFKAIGGSFKTIQGSGFITV